MTLDADRLVDRRRLKRSLVVWRLVAVVAAAGLAAILTAQFGEPLPSRAHVARLSVSGLIVTDRARDEALDKLADRDSTKALIVRIDSPGGTVVGGESLYRALRRVAEKKPVVAVMDELAASAAYMIALAADHVVAREGTMTGSIGVVMQSADLTGLLGELGIKPELIKSGPLKAQPNPLEPLSDEGRAVNRALVLDMYELFVDMVAERRGIARDRVLTLADGRVFTGRQALAAGLVDATGGEHDARRWLEETAKVAADLPVADLDIEHKGGAWREVWRGAVSGLFGKTLLPERLSLDGLVSLWHLGGRY